MRDVCGWKRGNEDSQENELQQDIKKTSRGAKGGRWAWTVPNAK